MKQVLTDGRGFRIGEIEHDGNNKILRDARGTRLGTYNFIENMTRLARGERVGPGDQLLRLL